MAGELVVTTAPHLYRRLENTCITVVPYGLYASGYDLVISGPPAVHLKDYGGIWAFTRVINYYLEAIELLNDNDARLNVHDKLYVKLLELPIFTRFALASVVYD